MNPADVALLYSYTALGVGVILAAAGLGSALGWGLICSKFIEGIARQPEMRPQLTGATLARREPCLSISRSGLNQPGALATIELRLFRCLAGTSSCLPTAQAACLAALRRPKSSRRERAASR